MYTEIPLVTPMYTAGLVTLTINPQATHMAQMLKLNILIAAYMWRW